MIEYRRKANGGLHKARKGRLRLTLHKAIKTGSSAHKADLTCACLFGQDLAYFIPKRHDLAQLVKVWPKLPEDTKKAVKSLVDSANHKE